MAFPLPGNWKQPSLRGVLAPAFVLLALAMLVSAATTDRASHANSRRALVPADTDSVRARGVGLAPTDSDSVRISQMAPADSDSVSVAARDSFRLTRRYLKPLRKRIWTDSLTGRAAQTLPRRQHALLPGLGSYWKHETVMDSASRFYTVRERIGDHDVRGALRVPQKAYQRKRLHASISRNWKDLIQQHEEQRARASGRGGLGVNINVPGGRTSAFSTIFGKPQVDLRVHGEAQVHAGFNYRYSDQQASITGKASQLDPSFKQDLRLGITGTIGDKLSVNVDWDTQSQFDYQNQLKLDYTGHEDDILQNVEAGNVLLRSPSTLIDGGQKLFGIKSEFQLGGVHLTTIASQQEGQSNSLSLEGGAQEQNFELEPTEFEDRKHFFLSYFFRNAWEKEHQNPTTLNLQKGFDKITDIEVWRLQKTDPQAQTRNIAAMVDLGEQSGEQGGTAKDVPILNGNPRDYTTLALPAPGRDQYTPEELNNKVRPGDEDPRTFLRNQKSLTDADFQVGSNFTLLEPNKDFELHKRLGYISLNQALKENQALAVAFKYQTTNGQVVQVGDFSNNGGGSTGSTSEDNLVTKLIRPTNLRQPSADNAPAAWFLEMRNIYSLGGGGLSPSSFSLDIFYEPSGSTKERTLPDLTTQKQLLQLLGLDRQNSNGQLQPDNEFDYVNTTIDEQNGLIIFPYLEPFGRRLKQIIDNPKFEEKYVFNDLYVDKKSNARRNQDQDVYSIEGSYKGGQPSFYDLKAFSGLVKGSVTVSSGGTELKEGSDYIVDYQSGTVTITDKHYLAAGRKIDIDYEQNKLFNIQKKTLLGARADYKLGEKFAIGATAMRLSQRSPVDKFRIGEEPVSNTILGLDGSIDLNPRWLTWAVDALPLIQTKAPSAISLSGEVAQLRPGHSQTQAFDRSRSELQDKNLDFKPDELQGISYIDDFEGFENTFSLTTPGSWRIASSPRHLYGLTDAPTQNGERTRSNWRGSMSWYKLNSSTSEELRNRNNPSAAFVRPARKQVFPNRPPPSNRDDGKIEPFDVFFNPHKRGPYNYNRNLQGFLNHPRKTWGGITVNLPEGYNDFNKKNIEFVEFVFKPFFEENVPNRASDARLVVDLGSISEDVIPNGRWNQEDGLSINELSTASLDEVSRLPSGLSDGSLDISEGKHKRTEDLGLDGLASYEGAGKDYQTPDGATLTEQAVYASILEDMAASCTTDRCQKAVKRARNDPSNDDYHFYSSDFYDGKDVLPQEHFSHFFAGQELNGFESQDELGDGQQGNARYPDGEDLNQNSTIDTKNNYFQYELPLSPDKLDELAANDDPNDYVVNKIDDNDSRSSDDWYLIRIPIKKFTRSVGDKQDFSLIQALRLWTSGLKTPVTMRFATMELVGSQWRSSEKVSWHAGAGLPPFPTPPGAEDTRLSISSINNEENTGSYAIPVGTVRKQTNAGATGGRRRAAREQSLVMRVENLRPQQQRAIFKTYNRGLNLLKYKHLRMFVHMNGSLGGQLLRRIPEKTRKHIKLFMRLGTNQATDYYEYEQPLTPSKPKAPRNENGEINVAARQQLWQTQQPHDGQDLACPERPARVDLNSVNIKVSALNRLKFQRNNTANALRDSLFWSDTVGPDGKPVVATCFAPPGTRLAVKGNPSLGEVKTIVIGVRYDADQGKRTLRNLEMWLNELRVSGYDQDNGWAGLANANIKLADFGTLRGNFRRRTAGFGSLNSTLGDRRQINRLNWTFGSQFYLDKLLPTRFGWRIPFSFQISSNTTTPKYDPNRGDIRIEAILNQLKETGSEQTTVDEALEAAQTHNVSRSLSVNVSKQGSESFWLRNTLDGLSVNYQLSNNNSRSPSQQRDNSWKWNTSLDYNLSAQPHTVSPFSFMSGIPLLSTIANLAFNYVPSSVSFRGNARRRFSATKERPSPNPVSSSLPPSIQYQLRDQENFSAKRSFGFQYNPLNFINLSFDTDTRQSLTPISTDTLYSVVLVDKETGRRDRILQGTRKSELDTDELEEQQLVAYERDSLNVASTGDVVSQIFNGADDVHTKNTGQRFNATLSFSFLRNLSWLDWLQPQDLSYSANYSWKNGAIGSKTGANISITSNYKTGLQIKPQDLLRKFGFYRQLEEAQKEAEQEQQQRQTAPTPKKPKKNPKEGEQEGAEGNNQPAGGASDSLSEGGLNLGEYLPDPVNLLRRTVLAVTSIPNISINYTASRSGRSSNVGRPKYKDDGGVEAVSDKYGLLGALQGEAPPLAYRFGLNRRLAPSTGFRVMDSTLRVQDNITNGNRITANTTISPSDNFQINLNWNTKWNRRSNTTFNFDFSADCPFSSRRTEAAAQTPSCINDRPNRNGTNTTSTWAFGGSYRSLFEEQLATLQGDFQPDDRIISDSTGNRDGRTVLTEESVLNDFRSVYSNGFGPVDSRGLLPFPLPGWKITYSGVSEWPFISSLVQRASLTHGYTATYKSGYQTEFNPNDKASFKFAGKNVVYDVLPFRINSMDVNERFNPLIGLDVSWKGNLQTNISWNRTIAHRLSTSSMTVSETTQNKINFNASYQQKGLNIPFLPIERLSNTIRISLSASYSLNDDRRYRLQTALEQAAQEGPSTYDPAQAIELGKNREQLARSSRLTISPRISYTISNRVSADFTVKYEKLSSDKSTVPSSTNIDGGVNVRVSIAN